MVRVLLLSTYELGHQPLHVASPAAVLMSAGHDVMAVDLSIDRLGDEAIEWAEAVGISVPMHTALRLAAGVVDRCRRIRPGLPIALYGLYAGMNPELDVDAMLVGEYEAGLLSWVGDTTGGGLAVDLGRQSFQVPERGLLPPLDAYAHLRTGDLHRVVGYVEASHGCRHRCRHCPIPAVYDGRYRIVGEETVVADVLAQVEAGAGHITFGDPDFLNGPAYAMAVLERCHREVPAVTFDVTIKVEHLLRHSDLVRRLPGLGVLFAISAFESTDDRTLRLLEKGHTVADMRAAMDLCREVGLDLHPSWMPFVPWTAPGDVVDIFRFLDGHDLLTITDPVQMSIKLLIPPGSLMLEVPEVAEAVGDFDPGALGYQWAFADPAAGVLQQSLAAMAEEADAVGRDPVETLVAMWAVALDAAGADASEAQIPPGATVGRPRMTESWFC